MAERLAARTTTLSATLLRLAARGHLPEPAHALVENGDIGPLLDFGATSGKGIALGLAFAGQEEWDEAAARSLARAGTAARRPRKASDREEMALV
jgi:hypothetical protein